MNVRRWKRSLLIAAVGLLIGKTPLFAQQTDPALTSAVLGQTAALKKIHKDRKKTQEKIIAAEVAVTASLERIHQVEDKMLDYLSNAQGAMQNLYQIKRAGELVAKEIPQNCSLLLKSVGGNLKGTVIAAMVSDELTDAATQGELAERFGTLLHRQRGCQLFGSHQHRPVYSGLAGTHTLMERPLVLARSRRMGQRDVRQEHHRRYHLGLEPGLQPEMVNR